MRVHAPRRPASTNLGSLHRLRLAQDIHNGLRHLAFASAVGGGAHVRVQHLHHDRAAVVVRLVHHAEVALADHRPKLHLRRPRRVRAGVRCEAAEQTRAAAAVDDPARTSSALISLTRTPPIFARTRCNADVGGAAAAALPDRDARD